MNETPNVPDPRPAFTETIALVGSTLAAVRPDQLDRATPCHEYTVRDLSNHLVAVLRRIVVIGRGGDASDMPRVADDVADGDGPKAWDTAAAEVQNIWSDPALMGRMLTLPFATLPGAVATLVYTGEFTIHTWDLATATGQHPTWNPKTLTTLLESSRRAIPAERRGDPIPFDAVIDVPADAPDIDKLVAWYGRRP